MLPKSSRGPRNFSFSTWGQTLPSGEKLTLATAHRSELPTFPMLALASGRYEGQQVTVVGFGRISPIISGWSTSGRIEKCGRLAMAGVSSRPHMTAAPSPETAAPPCWTLMDVSWGSIRGTPLIRAARQRAKAWRPETGVPFDPTKITTRFGQENV
jgi:hypothetical protein